ncbi:MAG: hypothetical protein IKR81_14310 [Victivallales bacterium]|nr:hypothetical protein [Victivallales bacterium]
MAFEFVCAGAFAAGCAALPAPFGAGASEAWPDEPAAFCEEADATGVGDGRTGAPASPEGLPPSAFRLARGTKVLAFLAAWPVACGSTLRPRTICWNLCSISGVRNSGLFSEWIKTIISKPRLLRYSLKAVSSRPMPQGMFSMK